MVISSLVPRPPQAFNCGFGYKSGLGLVDFVPYKNPSEYSLECKWDGAHRARSEAECSMKLHPTCALENYNLYCSNYATLTCIVTMVICSNTCIYRYSCTIIGITVEQMTSLHCVSGPLTAGLSRRFIRDSINLGECGLAGERGRGEGRRREGGREGGREKESDKERESE